MCPTLVSLTSKANNKGSTVPSTFKDILSIRATPSTFKEAEKIVSGIVEKAEKVINECESQLQKENEESTASENPTMEKEEESPKSTLQTEDSEDSKQDRKEENPTEGVEEIVLSSKAKESESFQEISKGSQEVIDKIEKTMTVQPKSDSFDEIEKESNDIVEKLETSIKTPDDINSNIKPGFLKLIIFKGSNLKNSDVFGQSDPYVIVKFQDQEYRSRTSNNTLNPEWNFTANLNISTIEDSQINIEVYDEDKLQKDDLLGSYSLPLSRAISNTDKEAVWYNLDNGKSGKLLFSMIYIPSETPINANETSTVESEVVPEKKNLSNEKDEEVDQQESKMGDIIEDNLADHSS